MANRLSEVMLQKRMDESMTPENLEQVQAGLRGAKAKADNDESPPIKISEAKKNDPEGVGEKQDKDAEDRQQLIYSAILSIVPAAVGYAAGGLRGGAAGAEIGSKAVGDIQKIRTDSEKLAFEKAAKMRDLAKDEKKIMLEERKLNQDKEIAEQKNKTDLVVNSGKVGFERANALRDEYGKLAGEFKKVNDAYARIQKSGTEPSAAGDIALIYGFMKLNDPGSTVRESEFGTAQFAASVPERIKGLYNKVASGERLTAAQRADFLDQAEKLYGAQREQQDAIDSQYTALSKKFGVDPSAVLVNPGAGPSSQEINEKKAAKKVAEQSAGGNPLVREAHAAPAMPDFRSMSDAELKAWEKKFNLGK